MIYVKYYKHCENCGKSYLQQRKGTKYCKPCRNAIRAGHFKPHEPLPIRRFRRKPTPGTPINKVLEALAARDDA